MKNLTKNDEKYMTVKEVAGILGVTTEAIKKHIRELFPDKMQNGKITYLNEYQMTEIKKKMIPTTQVVACQTNLDIAEKTLEVVRYWTEKAKELQKENEIMKPKAISYDTFMNSDNSHSMKEVAKSLKIGPNILFRILRENNILMSGVNQNIPYQKYVDAGYFETVQRVIPNGDSKSVTLVTSKGYVFIEKYLKKLGK